MMTTRKTLLLALAILLGTARGWAQDQEFETAEEAVKNMRLGWNLGNTLDSHSGDTLNMWIEHWTSRTPSDYEKAWGQPVTKAALMKLFKEAGFNAIRVPVTWYPHMEAKFSSNSLEWSPSKDDFGTQIKKAWMQRVHQIVDYVISQGMYCILNIHHDTGEANTSWLIADEGIYARQHERFEAIWKQIAEEFKDYDEHLLFEGYNEMLDIKHSWCFASFGAEGNYDAAIATSAYNAINAYAQSFVDAVRSTGGNNAKRNLIVSTYGACNGGGTWNSHLQDPLKKMQLPDDPAGAGHLIFEVHSYPDVKNLTNAKTEVRTNMRNLKTHLVAKGAPVIIGEWGTSGVAEDYTNYHDNVLAFARYFVEQAKLNDIGTFYWMGLSDGTARSKPEFNQPDLVEAIVKGYYGDDGYVDDINPLQASRQDPQAFYTLSGQKLCGEPGQQGVYIQNGNKVLIAK